MAADADAAVQAWSKLVELDSLKVTVVVDNETDGLSTPCACCDPALDPPTRTPYVSETSTLVQAFGELDFRRVLYAGHGLSLLLTATAGGTSHTLLFDGGPSRVVYYEAAPPGFTICRPELWRINAEKLGLDCAAVEAAVLSHWHTDHSAGLAAVAQMASVARAAAAAAASEASSASASASQAHEPQANRGSEPSPGAGGGHGHGSAAPSLVFDLHPDRPVRRGFRLGDGRNIPFTQEVEWQELELPGCRVEKHSEPHTLLDDFFYVSGAIPRISSFETGMPQHITQQSDGTWQLDPLVMDERYLAVNVKGQGAVVFSSCSHAGIVNVATDVRRVSGGRIFGILGGFHLAGRPFEDRILNTVDALKALDPHCIVAGHCTGWRAKAALAGAFRGRFQSCAVGGCYQFLAATSGDA